jgi:hypothetical protein
MEIAKEVAEGGLLRLVTSKPIQQAIGRLVSGAADVPIAYLESWAQRVRSDTLARKQITSVVAVAAKVLAVADNDLAKAGLDRWMNKLKVRQGSVDEVATRTIGVLAEEEIPYGAAVPEEDFMRMFEDIAERASSENVADLLARILAGEIRKPHSVSLRTLQVVTVMDQAIVAALKEIAPFCLDNNWWHIPPSLAQKWNGIFSLLNAVAITTRSDTQVLKVDNDGRRGWRQGSKGIVVSSPRSVKFGLVVLAAALTPIGEELLSILPFDRGSKLDEVGAGFKEDQHIQDVFIGDIVEEDGIWRIPNLIRL